MTRREKKDNLEDSSAGSCDKAVAVECSRYQE
jgi:hypothetical protein